MKNLRSLQVLAFCLAFVSCSKSSGNNAPVLRSSNSIDVVISPNQSYELNLGGATNASVFKQAAHYQTSETVANSENGSYSYRYLPGANFTGKDQVMISTTSVNPTSAVPSNECPSHSETTNATPSYSTSYTTINITVRD